MTAPLAPHELELLELLVAAYLQNREELFAVAYTSAGTAIKHTGFPVSEWRDDGAALAGLEAAGLLLVESHQGGHPKTFYLPNSAPAELEEARRQADEEAGARRAREEADRAGRLQPLTMAEALTRMIALHKEHPGGFFTPYDTSPNPSLGYSNRERELLPLSHGEFARLLTSGALEKRDDRFQLYYLSPTAGDTLAAEQRLQSDGPLATAERRLVRVERRIETTAQVVGWTMAALVLLASLYAVVNREVLFPPGGIGGIAYDVVTAVGGLTGVGLAYVAKRVVSWSTRAALRKLFDPEYPRAAG